MDINEEYLSIFGTEERPTLYAPDDKEYMSLRQEIIDAPREFNVKQVLPFEDIQLLAYEDYLNKEAVKEAEKKGFRIFYIKIDGVCNVSGYYVEDSKKFFVLEGSRFKNNTSRAFDETPTGISRMKFIEAVCFTNNPKSKQEWVVMCDTLCKSASIAASYVMGRVSSYMNWRDVNGKSLKDWYPNDFTANERKTKSDSTNKKHNKISTLTLEANIADEKDKVVNGMPSVQLFYIKKIFNVNRDCDAFGYYDPRTQKFILKEGSYLAIEMTDSYKFTAACKSRQDFTRKYCKKDVKGYRLRRDYLFDSPSMAASYVLGRTANGWMEWKTTENVPLVQTI